jgi:hypothetical protein
MKVKLYALLSIGLILQISGCGQRSELSDQQRVTPSVNPAFVQNTPVSGPLTLEMLKNAEYQVQNGMTLVKLVDGKYEAGSGSDFLSVSMLDQVAFGDLNSDVTQDAAILLSENYGGTGQFLYLVPVFNSGGNPTPSSGYFLGDRVRVKTASIADGRITLEMLVHAPNDAFCCPSQPMTQSFHYYWGPGLVLVHATSRTPVGDPREIIIDAPIKGSEVTNQIQLKGSVSISPFENNLVVRIVDANNIQIFQGPIMVSALDLGAPGTFETEVTLTGSPTGSGEIRIEVLDISMADGSTLAMDSVVVTLK